MANCRTPTLSFSTFSLPTKNATLNYAKTLSHHLVTFSIETSAKRGVAELKNDDSSATVSTSSISFRNLQRTYTN